MTATMASEERLSGSYGEMEEQNERIECATYNIPDPSVKGRVNMLLLQGPSVYDAWFSAASNQIAQVLLTLPTSFAQLGYASGVALQVVYGIMGSWACYMITWLYMEYRTRMEREGHTFKTLVIQWFEVLDGLLGRKWKYVGLAFNCVYLPFAAITQLIACGSNIFLLNNDLDKREWTYVFGACCLVTIFIPSFRNYRLYSCFGVVAITYTSWYMTVAALVYGQGIKPLHFLGLLLTRRREQPTMAPSLWFSTLPAPPTSFTPSAARLSPCMDSDDGNEPDSVQYPGAFCSS